MTDFTEVEEPEEAVELSSADVEALLSTMSKALRAFNMYQPNNPVFQRFQVALREAFDDLWEKTDRLDLGVAEDGFRYQGKVFSLGSGRESMAFAFYKDGVRSLSFLPGFEDEVGTFLRAVNRAMRREADVDDLVTMLWEEDFGSLLYGYLDLLMEGVSIPEEPRFENLALDGRFVTELSMPEEEEETDAVVGQAAPRAGLSREDFDETLYFLDPSETAALQKEVEVEMARELRADVLNALFDRLEEPHADRQREILEILDQLLPLLLSRGDLRNAARILEELDRLQGNGGSIGDALRERIDRLFERLSDPQVLEQFVLAVEDGAVSPDSEEVNLFFSRLHAHALPILIRFSEMSEAPMVRSRLSAAIDGLASRYPAEVNALLTSDEPAIVAGACRVSGRIGLPEAVPGLRAALTHGESRVRLAVVEALVSIRTTPALQALTLALQDSDREIRIAAANALGRVRFASARDAFEKAVEGKRIREADITEKMAFFEAYGLLGGQAGVGKLAAMLNSKRLFGRRNPTEIRACAALGLGRATLPAAREALEKAKADDDPIVRSAVLRALKQEVEAP